MRRLSALVLVALVAACGGNQDPVVDGAGVGASSTTAVVAPGDPAAVDAGAPPAGGAADPAGGGSSGGDPTAGGDAGAGGEQPATEPDSGGGGAVPFAPPVAGRYTFHTTGTASGGGLVGGGQQAIDRQDLTTITALSADTVRQTSATPDGSQTTELRYEQGRVALLLLELALGGQTIRFVSADGVQFAPIPPSAGQAWNWQLTDESGQLTASFDATTAPTEAITVAGSSVDAYVVDATINVTGTFGGLPVNASVQVRNWVDPSRRTAVRTHQVSTITQPFQSTSDTTSELVSFTAG